MISREQLGSRLKEANYKHSRKTKRVEIWKERNGSNRVTFAIQNGFTEIEVRSTLKQAGLTPSQIEEFLRDAVDG